MAEGCCAALWILCLEIFECIGAFCSALCKCICPEQQDHSIPLIQKDLSMVGFSRRTIGHVENMLRIRAIDRCQIVPDMHILTKNADFIPNQLKRKVLLVCSYTQRDNILGEPPDEGEMSSVYQTAEGCGVDSILMYAGVPQKYYSADELFPQSYHRLLRSQPRLKKLMDERRFMVVDVTFNLNRIQQQRLSEWLLHDHNLPHRQTASYVDETYSLYK